MFKVGDFVYYKDYSMSPDFEDKFGYGYILEIKEIPKSFELGTDTVAIIQVKYFEDGTPCDWNSKEVIKIEMVEDAEIAWERHMAELDQEKERFVNMYKNDIKGGS